MIHAETVETKTAATLMSVHLPENWRKDITVRAESSIESDDTGRRQARAQAKIARAKEMYLESLMTKAEKDRAIAEAQAELDALQPVPQPDIERAAELLSNLPRVWELATEGERKTLFQAMLERVYVRGAEVVAIQPRQEIYPLLKIVYCGPDGCRVISATTETLC